MRRLLNVFLVVCLGISIAGCEDSPSAGSEGCPAGRTACGSACCDDTTQKCQDLVCVAKSTCGEEQTACGPECCDNSTQKCVDSVCVAKSACDPATEKACGSECCDNATQECVDSVCVAMSTCDPATEVACGSGCCDDATEVCADSICVAKASCNANQTACGTACCVNATQFCASAATSTCATLAECGTETQNLVCGASCCDSSAQACDQVSYACVKSCKVDESIGSFSVDGELVLYGDGRSLTGRIPTADDSLDEILLDLFNGYGVFKDGIGPGSYILAGDDLNHGTCGLCVILRADVIDGKAAATYMATGGAVEISDVTGRLAATLTNATFEQVIIDDRYMSTPHPVGCTAAIAGVDFNGAMPLFCDPIVPDCPDGKGCYSDGHYGDYVCKSEGSSAMGSSCEEDADCEPGLGCNGGAWNECSPFCDPSLGGTDCPPAYPRCQSYGDVGGCY